MAGGRKGRASGERPSEDGGRRVRAGAGLSRGGVGVGEPMGDADLAGLVSAWFERHARVLPWRTEPRDPWASLVSEVMAQQTQIARVVDRFPAFMERFPTPTALAQATEQEVLGLWRGMGYYRRARLLHAAARVIAAEHGGLVPGEVAALRALPGVGRYTAGAVSSIAFGRPEAIVDGNVARVLLRVHGCEGSAGEPETDRWCWSRAEELARASARPGVLNEGLMELGATVCVPRSPVCEGCPLREVCEARRLGAQERIPRARRRAEAVVVFAVALLATDPRGRVLMEQRAPRGMWASLWQVPTLEGEERATAREIRAWALGAVGRSVATFEVKTTHRLVRFDVRRVVVDAERAAALVGGGAGRQWMGMSEARGLPMSNTQHRIVEMLASARGGVVGGGRGRGARA